MTQPLIALILGWVICYLSSFHDYTTDYQGAIVSMRECGVIEILIYRNKKAQAGTPLKLFRLEQNPRTNIKEVKHRAR